MFDPERLMKIASPGAFRLTSAVVPTLAHPTAAFAGAAE
jgi:hypothetical protein